MLSTPWRPSHVPPTLPVPVPHGRNVRTINLLQAAVSFVQFLATVLAFTVRNWRYSKTLAPSYNSDGFFCLGGNWLIQAKIRTSHFIFPFTRLALRLFASDNRINLSCLFACPLPVPRSASHFTEQFQISAIIFCP